MSMPATLAQQVLVMFLLAAIGFLMFRAGKMTMEGNRTLGNILIYLSLPAVIVKSLMVERTAQNAWALVVGAVVGLVLLVVSGLVARLVCGRDAIGNFSATFPNPSFFGIPLVVSILGEESVFYNVGLIALMNLGQWTYGVSLLTGRRDDVSLRQLVRAPFMVAILLGVALFATQAPLPGILTTCLDDVAALNTPLAMFGIGVYLAQTDVRGMFLRRGNYRVALARNVLAPLASLALLSLLPLPYQMRMALLVAISCPVGSNVAIYAQLHDGDYAYAVQTIVVSVLLSVATIPSVVWLANLLWL